MAKYTITPWRYQKDLLRVRSEIYSTDPEDPTNSARRNAINQIMAWKMRGNLPHAIESTALLTDAFLHHQVPGNSSFSVRAVYSAAFTRFVTGFCDIGRNRERSLEPSSMLEIANKIGMPAHFVALRHEATHDEVPSLQRLMRVTEEALEWLWNLYWSRLEEPESEENVAAALPEIRAQAKEVLKTYRSARLETLRSKKSKSKGESPKKTADACSALFGRSQAMMDGFVSVLVEDKLLCPSKREIGSSLDGAFLIWDDLLQEIQSANRKFLRSLVGGLLRSISSASSASPEKDAEKEAMCLWVAHMLTDKAWASAVPERPQLQREALEWCCLRPARWAHFLGTKLLHGGDESLNADWDDLLAASQLGDVDTIPHVSEGASSGTVVDSNEIESAMEVDLELGSWLRAAGPVRTPIGVVR